MHEERSVVPGLPTKYSATAGAMKAKAFSARELETKTGSGGGRGGGIASTLLRVVLAESWGVVLGEDGADAFERRVDTMRGGKGGGGEEMNVAKRIQKSCRVNLKRLIDGERLVSSGRINNREVLTGKIGA